MRSRGSGARTGVSGATGSTGSRRSGARSEHPSCLAAPKPISAWSSVTSAVGCSVTAVRDGRSVDTTMGFSPLEGVPMATRSGSIDPGALLFVQRAHGLSVDDVDRTLNEESGLEGLSGGRGLRALEAAARDDEQAQLALGVYTYRIAGAVAAMAAAARGLDALVFTAGVGEHSVRVRADVCERLGFLGVELDPELNERSTPDSDVATSESAVRVLVIAARERARRRTRGASAPPQISSMKRPDRVPPAMMRRMRPLDVMARQALSQEDSPYGAVGVLHSGSDLEAWWISKDGEEVEPTLSVMDRDDLLYVIRGSFASSSRDASPPYSAPANCS